VTTVEKIDVTEHRAWNQQDRVTSHRRTLGGEDTGSRVGYFLKILGRKKNMATLKRRRKPRPLGKKRKLEKRYG